MSKYTNHEIAKHIMMLILTRAGEVISYDWDDEISSFNIKDCSKFKDEEWFSPIDPSTLTKEQMIDLGFGAWSDESELMLIPLWLVPFLKSEIELTSIFGEIEVTKISDIDKDHRFGRIAYGVIPSSVKE